MQVLSGETAWVLSDHLAAEPGEQMKLKNEIQQMPGKMKWHGWPSGELSVQAGQQVEVLDNKEEQVILHIIY